LIILIFIVALDTCQGDSGGPIMHFEPTQRQWVLAGITSYGIGCGLPDYAGVYTRISMYHSWLGPIVTDRYLQVSVNVTSSDLTDSARSILSSYWLIVLSLYAFAQR
jgi:secreted trypsin-like serine protease